MAKDFAEGAPRELLSQLEDMLYDSEVLIDTMLAIAEHADMFEGEFLLISGEPQH